MPDFKPRFGLNDAFLTEVSLLEKKNYTAFAYTVKANGKDFWGMIFKPNKNFPNNPVANQKEDAFKTIGHIVSAVANKDEVRKTYAQYKEAKFEEFVDAMIALLPSDFNEQKLQGFLQYQFKPRKGYDATFLEIPSSSKHGLFLVEHKGYGFKTNKLDSYQDETKDALTYVNKEGEVHPFVRTGWFMDSPYANRQGTTVVEQQPKEEEVVANVEDDDLPF